MSCTVQLGISEHTVNAHLGSIYQKFGVDSRVAAIAAARMVGKIALEKAQGNEISELL